MSIDLNTRPATSITITPEPKKPYEYTTGKKVAATEAEFLGHEGGFGFSDLLDIINPLQHIPIVSTIYRKLTGDEIGPGAKVLGGGLLGGITGLVTSVADAIFAQETGSDVADTAFSALTGSQKAKTETAIKTAEKIVDEKEAALAVSGDTSQTASIAATRGLIDSAREAITLPSELPETNGIPLTQNSVSGSVKNVLNKYQQAQILSQMQSTLLQSNAELGDSRSTREKERDKDKSWYDDPLLLKDQQNNIDWLSQIT